MKNWLKILVFCLFSDLVQAKNHSTILVDDLIGVEYFWDNDPGIGKATLINLTKSADVNTSLDIPTNTLPQGVHFLGIRLKTTLGQWSQTQTSLVYVHAPNPSGDPTVLSAIEYFFDDDLGFGKNIVQKISSKGGATPILTDITVPAKLAIGTHLIGVRTQTERGQWSATQLTPIAIFASQFTAIINRVEFFTVNDPGYGQGVSLPFSPANGQEVSVDSDLQLTFKSGGSTVFYFRTRDSNGRWSANYAVPMAITLVLASEPEYNNQVKVYPNPNKGIFTVEIEEIANGKDTKTLEVIDLMGRSIFQKNIETSGGKHYEIIDISTQATGQYFLRITGKKGDEVRKVIKEN